MSPVNPNRTIAVASIAYDDRTWPREQLDQERVALFAELLAGDDQLPAIEVVPDGPDRYLLADGVHRLEAARSLDLEHITAVVLETPEGVDPAEVAYDRALETAVHSAKPLSMAERRTAAFRLLEREPDLGIREVARRVGVAASTVSRWAQREQVLQSNTPEEGPVSYPPVLREVAAGFVRWFDRMERSRGLLDMVQRNRPGRVLADAFLERFDPDEARERLVQVQTWLGKAVEEVDRQSREEGL